MMRKSILQRSLSTVSATARTTTATSRSVPVLREAARATRGYAVMPARNLRAGFAGRMYSTESEKSEQKEEKKEEAVTETENEKKLKEELEKKTKEAADFKDKYMRTVAEYHNLQDRTKREVKQAKDYALQKFAKDLVESVDNLERALGTVPPELRDPAKNKDLHDLFQGLTMTEEILMNTLKKHGLERFDPMDEEFNPNRHEATFQVHMPGKEPNKVFHVQQKGFELNGRILRAAQVGVTKAA